MMRGRNEEGKEERKKGGKEGRRETGLGRGEEMKAVRAARFCAVTSLGGEAIHSRGDRRW